MDRPYSTYGRHLCRTTEPTRQLWHPEVGRRAYSVSPEGSKQTWPAVPPGMSFPAIGVLDRAEFRQGIELLNDDHTPILFVLQALQDHGGLSHGDASIAWPFVIIEAEC